VILMPTHAETTERLIESLSREERVRLRAQELYWLRGDRPGSAVDDWLRAEEVIRRGLKSKQSTRTPEGSFPASDPPAH
jgi:hypothetical protein